MVILNGPIIFHPFPPFFGCHVLVECIGSNHWMMVAISVFDTWCSTLKTATNSVAQIAKYETYEKVCTKHT